MEKLTMDVLSNPDQSAAKTRSRNKNGRTMASLICPECGCEFERELRFAKRVENPKCSRRCNALYNIKNNGWGKSK